MRPEMQWKNDERVRQVAIGVSILVMLTIVVTGTLLGWRLLPGLLGEWIGLMIGILTTPFFLEASFIIIGLIIVIALNHWRQQKEGEELVYLDQVTDPEVPPDLPDHTSWAVYVDKPPEFVKPSLLTQAEGAFALGDFTATAQWIGEMDRNALRQPDALRLRRELALATGKQELAKQLDEEIRNLVASH